MPEIKQLKMPTWAGSMVMNLRAKLAKQCPEKIAIIALKTDDEIFSAREHLRGMNQEDILLSMEDWLNGEEI
jgi:hypothetical protein